MVFKMKNSTSHGKTFSKIIAMTIIMLFAAMSSVSSAYADVVNIKSDAPTTYVVKKGDTLWDISNLFLDQAWLWPELWRNNVQIENPHLIYPGDILKLRYENGKPVLEIVRDKSSITLTPNSRVLNKPSAIDVLPWDMIAPYLSNDSMMDAEDYQVLPTVLGDNTGSPRFASKDYVLAHKLADANTPYQVVRKEREVFDSMGKSLGVQVSHLSDVEVSSSLSDERFVVRIIDSNKEAKQGDKLLPVNNSSQQDLKLLPAQRQVGEIVQNITGNVLIGKKDVVIVNLGKRKVRPGTVFGIYHQGPDVEYDEKPTYALTRSSIVDMFSFSETVKQPAYKIGELIILKSFEDASYAWVTTATTHMTGGEIIAKP
jgi:hypothetical protein